MNYYKKKIALLNERLAIESDNLREVVINPESFLSNLIRTRVRHDIDREKAFLFGNGAIMKGGSGESNVQSKM